MEFIHQLLAILPNNENIIQWGGLGIIAALVFIETGFLVGLIIPGGETLLFTAGLLCGTNTLNTSIVVVIISLIGAAIVGDITGFYIGKKLGRRIHNRPDSFLFKKAYWQQAEDFYKKHGKAALILGRFMPIVRTFNPLISGTSGMNFGQFVILAVIGCILYISSIVVAGYLLGQQFPQSKEYIKYILPAIVLLALIPVIKKFLKERKKLQLSEKSS